MSAESKRSPSWVRIGTTYGGVVAGMIAGLVYHAGAQRGQRSGATVEPAEAGPGWYFVWVDQPHRHLQLSSPAPPLGAPTEELDKSVLVALAEAGERIEARLVEEDSGAPDGR